MKAYRNILHITDIHLQAAGQFDQDLVLDAALRDIATLKGGALQPDLVVVSGDLVQAADAQNAYNRALELLIRIGSAADLDEEKIVLAPGNHDSSRQVIGPRLPNVQQWQDSATHRDGANQLSKDSLFPAHIARAFGDYATLSSQFARAAHVTTGLGYSSYYFRDLGLAVVSVNTALLSTCGLIKGQSDERKLVLPEALLHEAMSSVPEGSHIVVTGHHPTGWLNEQNADTVEAMLAQKAALYLFGHVHQARPRTVRSLLGTCYYGQGGALFEWRDRPNGYAVYSVVPGSPHVRATYRRWYEDRRGFGKAEDLGEGGVLFSSAEAEPYFSGLRAPLDRRQLERWREEMLRPAVEAECSVSLSPVPLDQGFVAPEFVREILPSKENPDNLAPKIESLTFDRVRESRANYLVSAPAQSGKTTTLRRWTLEVTRSPATEDGWAVPLILSFGDLREYPAYIETLITRKLPPLPVELRTRFLLEQGAVLLLVDDVDFRQRGKLKALSDFMKSYPTCRYVLTTASMLLDNAAWEPVITPELPFTHVRLRPMRRRQLLDLIERHGVDDPQRADQLLERVMREARSLHVPLNAVTGTFLIQVFSTEPDRVLVNKATLVERYVELLLQRFTRPDIELRSFDFKLKRDLLSVIAGQMAAAENYTPTYNEVNQWVLDYVEHYGFPQQAGEIIEHFLGCRIIEKVQSGDVTHLRFTLTAFLSYFLAWRMIENKDFREWVLDPIRYLSYSDEVSFYAALVRNDMSALNLVFSDFEKLSEQMWADASEEVKSGTFMDDYVEPHSEASEEEVFAIQQVVRSNEETDRERQMKLEDTVGSFNPTPIVARNTFETLGERWTAHLELASSVLKHMELIPDAQKRSLLRTMMTAWLRFCTLSLSIVPQIARDKVVTINGITYKLAMHVDEPIGELTRRISLAMPLAVSFLATHDIGSEKLKLQLMEGIGSAEMSASEQLLRALLLADIGVDEVAEILTRARDGVRGHRYLTNVLARKLYDVAIRFRLDEESLNRVRALASDMLVKLEGKPAAMTNTRRNQLIKSMRDQRVVAHFGDRLEQ